MEWQERGMKVRGGYFRVEKDSPAGRLGLGEVGSCCGNADWMLTPILSYMCHWDFLLQNLGCFLGSGEENPLIPIFSSSLY